MTEGQTVSLVEVVAREDLVLILDAVNHALLYVTAHVEAAEHLDLRGAAAPPLGVLLAKAHKKLTEIVRPSPGACCPHCEALGCETPHASG